jgi:hypothetical protein
MFKKRVLPIAALLAAIHPIAGLAADDADLKALRGELKNLRDSYQQRIDALEKRLADAEAKAGKAEDVAARADSTARAAGLRQSGDNAFNPAISLILSGMYSNLKQDPQAAPYRIAGFLPSNGDVAPTPRSFNLGESEMAISANVDPDFRGQLTVSLPATEGAAPAVEEGYIQTLALGKGFGLKAGRFLSGLGYMNEQHAHAWDFSDAPLPYKAFFGGQMRGEGVQLKWLAPTDTFLEFGAEAGRGGAFPSTDLNKNGVHTGTLFAHVGGDAGISNSWRAGLSYIGTSPRNRSYTDTDANGATTSNAFSGDSKTWVADGVWKWAPNGNTSLEYVNLQGEYFRRSEDGTLSCAAGVCGNPGVAGAYRSSQSGWYAQSVWQFLPTWRAGYRYDRLSPGSVDLGGLNAADFPILATFAPSRNTLMLDWNPSEFSRLRLQFARDDSQPGPTDKQWLLHYIVSLGPHGAHKF